MKLTCQLGKWGGASLNLDLEECHPPPAPSSSPELACTPPRQRTPPEENILQTLYPHPLTEAHLFHQHPLHSEVYWCKCEAPQTIYPRPVK
ncbi:hypothetical protein FKM82_030935 [Ascaphus truei]